MDYWKYIDPVVKTFLKRLIQIGVGGLVAATVIHIADGATNRLFIWINSGGAVFFTLLLIRPKLFPDFFKILLIAAYFWIQIITSFLYSGLLGSGTIPGRWPQLSGVY